ncbi:hypothetical protein N9113_01635 [Akkermansiaceae bacterium]|nr:hypothetical protein [Akkermansiaceae bacterium]
MFIDPEDAVEFLSRVRRRREIEKIEWPTCDGRIALLRGPDEEISGSGQKIAHSGICAPEQAMALILRIRGVRLLQNGWNIRKGLSQRKKW